MNAPKKASAQGQGVPPVLLGSLGQAVAAYPEHPDRSVGAQKELGIGKAFALCLKNVECYDF